MQPIYLQIAERIGRRVISGEYPPGGKLPPVRELAVEAGVNPNTMQRAMTELEDEGLVYAQRTSGRFITEDTNMIQELKTQLATAQIQEFLERMSKMGLTKEEVLNLVEKNMKE